MFKLDCNWQMLSYTLLKMFNIFKYRSIIWNCNSSIAHFRFNFIILCKIYLANLWYEPLCFVWFWGVENLKTFFNIKLYSLSLKHRISTLVPVVYMPDHCALRSRSPLIAYSIEKQMGAQEESLRVLKGALTW